MLDPGPHFNARKLGVVVERWDHRPSLGFCWQLYSSWNVISSSSTKAELDTGSSFAKGDYTTALYSVWLKIREQGRQTDNQRSCWSWWRWRMGAATEQRRDGYRRTNSVKPLAIEDGLIEKKIHRCKQSVKLEQETRCKQSPFAKAAKDKKGGPTAAAVTTWWIDTAILFNWNSLYSQQLFLFYSCSCWIEKKKLE